jgi:hypothetical protein
VRFCPVLPITANEAAYKRVHGPAALEEAWLQAGTDLRDPGRREPAAIAHRPRRRSGDDAIQRPSDGPVGQT